MFETFKAAPLSGSFMITSMLGFLLTVIYYDNVGDTWGFTLALFFIIMFIASFISMTYGPVPEKEIK
ncbi:hypothetical protein ACFLZ7_00315 [Nanoarchaeota archaeon]